MPETDADGAAALLERARVALAAAMAARGAPVTASIGAVTFATPAASVDELIGEADALMYEVKRGGKDAVRVERRDQSRVTSQTSPSADSRAK
jgi:PleD family two-component response regulator